MVNDCVVRTRGLSRRYGAKWALNALDLEIERGGVHAIVGRGGV